MKFNLKILTEKSFQIISLSGEAKSEAMIALNCAKKKNFEEAELRLEVANKNIIEAQKFHIDLIQSEAKGNEIKIPLILMHAEDQMISIQQLILIINELVEIYKKHQTQG